MIGECDGSSEAAGRGAKRRRRTEKEESCSSGAARKEQGTFYDGRHLRTRVTVASKQSGVPEASTGRRRGDNDENCKLLLRPIADTLRRRASEGFALPLPGMPAANRQHVRHCGFLRCRRNRDRRYVEHLPPRVRQRLSRHPPLLRHMRLDSLLVPVPEAWRGGGGGRLFCRSCISRTIAVGLRGAPTRLNGLASTEVAISGAVRTASR